MAEKERSRAAGDRSGSGNARSTQSKTENSSASRQGASDVFTLRVKPEKAPKELYALRARWRDQIFADGELNHATFRVGYAMAETITMEKTVRFWRKTGNVKIFPSQEAVAQNAHVSNSTAQTAIKQLIERKHLECVKRGNQVTRSNHYVVLIREMSK